MKAKVLIVSQDNDTVCEIKTTLEKEGHKVDALDIMPQVTDKCREEKYDLAFIDVHVREKKYNNVIADIRKHSPETEIVMITTYAFPESMAKGEVLDIAGYLIKPFSKAKIKNVTARALRQSELMKENRRLLLAVTAAKKEWEATVDAIEDPIFVTDFDYNILRANLATFQKLGKGVNEVVAHKCYKIFHCSNDVLDHCPGKQARDTGEPGSETMLFKGLKKRLSCSVYPQVFAGGGGLVHYLREPQIDTGQQAEAMTKYERLFDDARIPILFVSSDDYKVIDANQEAIRLFGFDPEKILDMDLEELFAASLRETAINNIIGQIESKEPPLRVKVTNSSKADIDVFLVVNPTNIGSASYIELFLIPVDMLSGAR
jgi:PAS domain S-box-containing protein